MSGPAEEIEALRAQYAAALREVERLSAPDDHGAGARTARLAGLAAWQAEVERLRALIEAAGDGRDPAPP